MLPKASPGHDRPALCCRLFGFLRVGAEAQRWTTQGNRALEGGQAMDEAFTDPVFGSWSMCTA